MPYHAFVDDAPHALALFGLEFLAQALETQLKRARLVQGTEGEILRAWSG